MILDVVLKFIVIQILQALITAKMVKDSVLEVLKLIATHTKNKFDDKIYRRVKFYFYKDTSEHLVIPEETAVPPEDPNKQ